MEAGKTLLERQYKNALHCAYVIASVEGPTGFYKGYLANLCLGAGTAIMLIIFQQIDGPQTPKCGTLWTTIGIYEN